MALGFQMGGEWVLRVDSGGNVVCFLYGTSSGGGVTSSTFIARFGGDRCAVVKWLFEEGWS